MKVQLRSSSIYALRAGFLQAPRMKPSIQKIMIGLASVAGAMKTKGGRL